MVCTYDTLVTLVGRHHERSSVKCVFEIDRSSTVDEEFETCNRVLVSCNVHQSAHHVITKVNQGLLELGQDKHQTLITVLRPKKEKNEAREKSSTFEITYTAQCNGENSEPLVEYWVSILMRISTQPS